MDKIDTEFDGLTKTEILTKYQNNLKQMRNCAKWHRITGVEYNILLGNQQQLLNNTPHSITTFLRIHLWNVKKIAFIGLIFVSIGFLYYKTEVSGIFMKNIQNYIYPGMSMWRKVTLPILRTFPSLSSLYDETCLLPNPFFQVTDFDCTPCMDAVNIMDLTNIPHHESTVPYIFKTNTTSVNVNSFYKIYVQHNEIFKTDAYKVQSTNKDITNLDHLFNDFLNQSYQNESHNLWRCNRMTPARLLRQELPHPNGLPSIGMSIERYLTIDTPSSPSYAMPDIDCSNVFIVQLMGARTIVLRPTTECKHKCRTLSVRLEESYVLSYDWWYWKPISMPDHQTPLPSISYVGAFC